MDARLQLRVQRYGWDKAEPFYEKGWRHSLKPAQDLLIEMAEVQPRDKVLDVSCGTGIVSFEAAKMVGNTGYVVGTDISDEMVKASLRNASAMGLRNTAFLQMQAEDLLLDSNAFNVVLNALGLMYYPNPKKAIQEMNRVVKPGGRVVSAVWGSRSECGWAEIFPIVDSNVKTEVCPLFFQLGTGDTLANFYEACGLRDVHLKRISSRLHYFSDKDALNAVFAGGPVAMAYSRFDHHTKEKVHQAYLRSIEEYKIEGEYLIPGEFVVVSGKKAW